MDDSVESPVSIEPIKSRFGLNVTERRINEKSCVLSVMLTLVVVVGYGTCTS